MTPILAEANALLGQALGNFYNTYYFMSGMTISINRYGSALTAGEPIYAGLQFEAFVKYLTMYDSSVIQTADCIKQLRDALIKRGLPDANYFKQEVLDLQNQISLNGLPSEVIDYFKSLGFTESQISDIRQAILDYTPPDNILKSLHANLSDGANLLLSASSVRPPFPPAIYLLLLE